MVILSNIQFHSGSLPFFLMLLGFWEIKKIYLQMSLETIRGNISRLYEISLYSPAQNSV